MTSQARRILRATAAVTGMAALGAGFAGTAAAAAPASAEAEMNEYAINTAKIDGFDSDQVGSPGHSTSALQGVLAELPVSALPISGTDSLPLDEFELFSFEVPSQAILQDKSVQTAADSSGSDAVGGALGPAGEAVGPAGEGSGAAAEAVGQQATQSDPSEQDFAQDTGTPFGLADPANSQVEPTVGAGRPALAMLWDALADVTSDNDWTSNHNVEV